MACGPCAKRAAARREANGENGQVFRVEYPAAVTSVPFASRAEALQHARNLGAPDPEAAVGKYRK